MKLCILVPSVLSLLVPALAFADPASGDSAVAAPLPPLASAPAPAPAPPPAPLPAPSAVVPIASGQAVPPRDREEVSPRDREEADPRTRHAVSVTFSPLNLILPEVKVMVEARVARKMGVAAFGGYGSLKVDNFPERFSVWEAGGQFRYYLVGSFEHGMEIGAQAEYLGVSTSASAAGVHILGAGSGFAVGPFVGYKLATKVGFTLDLQGGLAYEAAVASANSSDGQSASASRSALVPILNLNLGWSF